MRDRVVAAGAMILGLTTLIVTAVRLTFAVDFTDEALYAVIPYRFALGAKPFVDELLFQQTSAFITYPFVKLFYMLTGGTFGIILYMRFLYLVFMALVGLCVWISVRRFTGRSFAAIAALPCLAFIYFNIPSLTYNTLGIGFLTAGLFLGFYGVIDDRRWLPAAGVAHGLAVVAYPGLAIAIIVFAAVLAVVNRTAKSPLREWLMYVAGGLAVAAGLLAAFLIFGISEVVNSYNNTSSTGIFGGGLSKAYGLVSAIWSSYQGKMVLLAGIIAALYLKFKRPFWAGVLLLAAPFAPLAVIGFEGCLKSAGYIAYYALMAPVLLFFIYEKREARQLLWLVWLPGFVAGLLASYTSSNGHLALSIGLFPGAMVTSVFLVQAIKKLWGERSAARPVSAVVLAVPVVILLVFQFGLPYRDDSIASLTARVTSGGYAGISTSPAKRDFLESVTRDVLRAERGADTILVFDNFPAGYLISDLTPYTDKTWIAPMAQYPGVDKATTVKYYREKKRNPDLVVRMNTSFYMTGYQEPLIYPSDDPLNDFVSGQAYRPLIKRQDYTIYERRR